VRIHLQVQGAPDLVAEHTRRLHALGVDGVFTFEGQHDVFLPLAVAAGQAPVQSMTNVAIAGPRSPLHLAHAAYDLQQYTNGRFGLGLGSQVKAHIEKRYSARWDSPAAKMAETVQAIKAIFAAWEGQSPLAFRGEYFTHTLMPPNFNPGPNPYGPPPILMGALGPIMTRTAAEFADGLLVMPFNSTRHFADRTLPAVAKGLARSGRVPEQFEIIAQSMVAMGRTEAELNVAINAVASLIAFYGSTPAYLPVLEIEGWAHLQPELNAMSKVGKFAEMRALITDEMVARLGVVGTPEECAAQIGDRFGDGVHDVCCYFPGYEPSGEQITALVEALHGLGTPA
jgi:probable F420-dependent oxidoreductase